MKITFFGLSCFLIESKCGDKILLDPFNDSLEYGLGPILPKSLQVDFIYSSHSDPDHYNPRIKTIRKTDLYLKKSIPSTEFSGNKFSINILEVDELRLCHMADQSTLLSDEQLSELGKVDLVFYPAPKVDGQINEKCMEIARKNLKKIDARIIIWSHLVLPDDWQEGVFGGDLRDLFKTYLKNHAGRNKNYKDSGSFLELAYILENAIELGKDFNNKIISKNFIIIDKDELDGKKEAILFSRMS